MLHVVYMFFSYVCLVHYSYVRLLKVFQQIATEMYFDFKTCLKVGREFSAPFPTCGNSQQLTLLTSVFDL